MNRFTALPRLAASLLAVLALAWVGGAANALASDHSVVGGVVIAPDGLPIEGAIVRHFPPWEHPEDLSDAPRSGEDGTFVLSSERVGRVRIQVSAPGYTPVITRPFRLVAGGEVFRRIELCGDPDAKKSVSTRSVHVLGADGMELDAAVLWYSIEGRRATLRGASPLTLPNAWARLQWVVARAGDERFEPARLEPVAPGRTPLRLVLGEPVPLEGRVIDDAGGPLPGADVRLTWKPDGEWIVHRVLRTGSDGTFRMRLPRVHSHLIASASGYLPSSRVAIDPYALESPPEIELQCRKEIRVEMPEPVLLTGQVHLHGELFRPRAFLGVEGESFALPHRLPGTSIEEDGSFSFLLQQPGPRVLRVLSWSTPLCRPRHVSALTYPVDLERGRNVVDWRPGTGSLRLQLGPELGVSGVYLSAEWEKGIRYRIELGTQKCIELNQERTLALDAIPVGSYTVEYRRDGGRNVIEATRLHRREGIEIRAGEVTALEID